MTRADLVDMTRRTLAHARAGTVPLADGVRRVPAAVYHDPDRWALEVERIFRRLPLVLGFSSELRDPGAYKALDVCGTPVLLTRGASGEVRAFVNSCSHRGAVVVPDGTGTARRFACPYHAWTYDGDGCLVGILDREVFGDVDPASLGLTPLPVDERAGMVFVVPVPGASIDLDTTLCGYDEMLDHLGLADCHHVGTRTVDGRNWKVAYDGYLELYHLPVLHRDSFGPDTCNRAVYDSWGPHQRVSSPDGRVLALDGVPEADWPDGVLTDGIWTVFPHASIAGFKVAADGVDGGGRMYMVSTLFPGPGPGTSVTVQHFLTRFEPTDELGPAIEATKDFLVAVVRDEDYTTGLGIQRALATGARSEVLFGRNEAGGQRFHVWVDDVVAADTADALASLFADAEVVHQP